MKNDPFKELEALDKKIRNKIIRQAQRAGAKILAGQVKANAPEETGRTKRSVKVRAGKRKKDQISTAVVISGGHDAPFIGFLEFGTADQAPNPFIRKSVIQKRDDVIKSVADGIEDGIKSSL